jgi:ABC-type cobalamin transport system ATPase subunit
MNMNVTIAASSSELPWSRIATEVNAWRGACIQSFAQAEAAVTETLLTLSGVGERGKTVQLRHLIGQRLDDLAQALGPSGAFAEEGSVASVALAAFRTHEGLRTHLAHDLARIALQRNGSWVVVFRHLALRSRNAERGTVAFEQADALKLLSELRRKTQQLDAALGNLRRSVELKWLHHAKLRA